MERASECGAGSDARIESWQQFIRRAAPVGWPALCPELRLHLGGASVPLWEAVEQLLGRQVPPPYWAWAWPSGQLLARHLLDHPEWVRGRRVLDFGAGSGLVALAAARGGAAAVTAGEIDPLGREAVRLNAALNGLDVEVTGRDLIGSDEGWDVVVAGDVCYEQPLAQRVGAWLQQLADRGATVLLADQARPHSLSEGLEPLLRQCVPTSRDLEGVEARWVTVARLTGLPRRPPAVPVIPGNDPQHEHAGMPDSRFVDTRSVRV